MENQYLISPNILNLKTIPIENATKAELWSCQRRSIVYILAMIAGIYTNIQLIKFDFNGFSFLLILGVAIYSFAIIAFIRVMVRVSNKIQEIKSRG